MTQREVQQEDVLYAPLHIDMSEYGNAHAKEDSEQGQAVSKGSKLRPRTNSEDSTATRSTTATEDSTATRSTTATEESTRSSTATEESAVTGASTTLMIGGFPCHMNLSDLGHVLNDQGLGNSFDLVYLPRPKGLRTRNRSSQVNKGYAFVNFKTPELATAFADIFGKLVFQSGQLEKKCYAKPALCQGYAANLKQYSAYPDCCLLSF
jgi:RNA recognition motif-containing protein